ncbi:Transcription initiation factor IIE, beta subunit [Phaffia rhodozyma]|uniref:Transcription initiation factor IIE subunit beta n=1 Tax=Phaffia rhodozyma TaxID=264483 RepID=A0A0F7SSR8_PHARH|nr:Transcription initiation factor IIE, beta subunit [Phaffia rhodozyma]
MSSPSRSTDDASSPEKKKPAAQYSDLSAYSQPRDTGQGLHINTRISYAVRVLKERKGLPTRAEDIALASNWEELEWNPVFQNMLKEHERVTFDPKTKLFAFKADHAISTPAQVLSTIQQNKDKQGGISVKSLKESWNGSQQVLEELIQEGKVLPMRVKKDGPFKQVFFNEVGEERGGKAVTAEFRDAWHALKVPTDIERALKESGIKSSATNPSTHLPIQSNNKKKGKKGANRKVKLTNLHMAGLGVDLSKDRVGEAPPEKKKK